MSRADGPAPVAVWGAAGVALGLAGGAFLLAENRGGSLTWEGPFVLLGTPVLLAGAAALAAGLLLALLSRLLGRGALSATTHAALAGFVAAGVAGFSAGREMELSRAVRLALALGGGAAGALLAGRLARSPAGRWATSALLVAGAIATSGLAAAYVSLRSGERVYTGALDPRDFVPRFEPIADLPARALRAGRVLVVGIDGATWDRIDPLLAEGRLPNFARLRREGATGALASMRPTLSAALWTTAATGKPPEVHGIRRHYLLQGRFARRGNLRMPTWLGPVKDGLLAARLLRVVPVTSSVRRCKAIWNLGSEAGLKVGVLGWWASWPAEPVNGFVVSDLASAARLRELIDRGNRLENVGRQEETITYPSGLLEEIEPLERDPGTVTREELERFLPVDDETWEAYRQGDPFDWDRPLTIFRATYLKDLFFAAVAEELDRRGRPDLLLVYLKGIDVFGHVFWRYSDPGAVEAGASAGDVARYRDVVDRSYEWTDGLLGEFLGRLAPGETLVVLSDHGWETEGPGEYGHHRAPPGILAMIGGPVRPGARIEGASLLDVTPTLLHLLGLPKGEDMTGRVLEEVLEGLGPVRTIPTWETRRTGRFDAIASSEVEAQERALRALGYVK